MIRNHVVLVHGILDTGKVFRSLRADLMAHGARCLAPSLEPSDGRDGLEDLAHKLAATIEAQWGQERPIDLIGFSMGGLIARYYLQELGGHLRTRRFFAISAPFGGTLWSRLYPGLGAAQMAPGSAFLGRLEQTEDLLDGIELYSFWTPFDLVIIPPASSIWPRAENIRVLAPCHPCMLWSRELKGHIVSRMGLIPLDPGPPAGPPG